MADRTQGSDLSHAFQIFDSSAQRIVGHEGVVMDAKNVDRFPLHIRQMFVDDGLKVFRLWSPHLE